MKKNKIGGYIKLFLKIYLSLGIFLLLFQPNLPNTSIDTTPSAVFAEGSTTKTREDIEKESIISWSNGLEFVSHFAYMAIWPLIFLSGLAMDNQLIYGSFMNLDTYLWKIRQIVRNFSNFALGFIFLLSILIYNLSPNENKMVQKYSPKKLIPKILIAGVLINVSWFIMMALVDISTVLTYSLGGIPLSVVNYTESSNSQEEAFEQKLLGLNLSINYGDGGFQQGNADNMMIIYRNYNDHYIAPCFKVSTSDKDSAQTFLLGRAFDTIKTGAKEGQEISMIPGYCFYMGAVFSFPGYASSLGGTDYYNGLMALKSDIDNHKNDKEKLQKLVDIGMIYPVVSTSISPVKNFSGEDRVTFGEGDGAKTYIRAESDCPYVGYLTGGSTQCIYEKSPNFTVQTLLKKANSYTGPFVSMYTSLLDYSYLTNSGGLTMKFMEMLLNAIFAVLLVLPLAAMAVVLFARVAILWIVIAVSPAALLLGIFKDLFGKGVGGDSKRGKHFEFKNIIKLLFAPVLIVFAVSISVIFMTALKHTFPINGMIEEDLKQTAVAEGTTIRNNLQKLGFDVSNEGMSFLGFIKVKYESGTIALNWIIVMLFGTAITWFLLFWAIKQNSIGEMVGGSLQKLGERILGSIPIIPTSKGSVGFGALSNNNINRYVNDLGSKITRKDDDIIAKLFSGDPKKSNENIDFSKFSDNDKTAYYDALYRGSNSFKSESGKTISVKDGFVGGYAGNNFKLIQEEINKLTDIPRRDALQTSLDKYYEEYLDFSQIADQDALDEMINKDYLRAYIEKIYKDKEVTIAQNKKYKIQKNPDGTLGSVEVGP